MRFLIKTLYYYSNQSFYNFKKTIRTIRGRKSIFRFVKDYSTFEKGLKNNNEWKKQSSYPCLADNIAEGGTTKGHYFHQDLWVAGQIFKENPEKHVDVGSRIDGFVAHVASFRPIEVFDVRPITSKIRNIFFVQEDFSKYNFSRTDHCDSLSCLHALEHFGLGRYGDPIDPDGHIKGLNNLHKLLKKGGIFYFSVPMGPQRIEFNAHRVFSLSHLMELLKDKFTIRCFSYVDDSGDFHENVSLTEENIQTNLGCNWGCAIFKLHKI